MCGMLHNHCSCKLHRSLRTVVYSPCPASSSSHTPARRPIFKWMGVRIEPDIVGIYPTIYRCHQQYPKSNRPGELTLVCTFGQSPSSSQVGSPILGLNKEPTRGQREREVAAAGERASICAGPTPQWMSVWNVRTSLPHFHRPRRRSSHRARVSTPCAHPASDCSSPTCLLLSWRHQKHYSSRGSSVRSPITRPHGAPCASVYLQACHHR